jgi:hypothetical protein
MLRREPPSSSGGISLGGILFIIFLSLRLTDVDHWSWWWVTAPVWMPWVIAPRALFLGITRR